jgi:aminoglycoside phosphotransferase (APT) family kinase protein
MQLIDRIPDTRHLIHGDFHTGNVFLQNSEPMLIDMDRLATGDPVFELGDMYLYFAASDTKNPEDMDPYLKIPYRTCRQFFSLFLRYYLQTEEESRICEVTSRAALLGNLRLINRYWKAGRLTEKGSREVGRLINVVRNLLEFAEGGQHGTKAYVS